MDTDQEHGYCCCKKGYAKRLAQVAKCYYALCLLLDGVRIHEGKDINTRKIGGLYSSIEAK
jgi:hypothetical protein